MVFKSDAQRKGFFANRGFTRSQLQPLIQKDSSGHLKRNKNNPTKPRLSKPKREFVAKEIRRGIKEGRPSKQAIAIAFSKARKRFGNSGLRITRTITNPNGRLDERTRRLLFLLLGTAIALRILRQFRE